MIVIVTLMTGCASGKLANNSWCVLNSPFYLTEAEIQSFTKENKKAIIEHNEFGERYCGWKKPNE